MTEARVIWFYISLILIPDIHRFGLFHGDIPISTTLLTPLSTLPSILGIGSLAGFAILRHKQYPVIGFAILWFLFGHSLESSIFGLEIAFEHRNYIPSFGILLAIGYFSNHLRKTTGNLRRIIWIALPLLVLTIAVTTWNRANAWRDTYSLAEENVRNHPDSPRANDMAARINLEKGNIRKSIEYLQNGARVAPDEVGFLIDMHIVLAGLAGKINEENDHAADGGLHPDRVDIKGLPDNITSTMADGVIRLSPGDNTENSIKNLLQTRAISSHGIMSLDYLHDCILNPPNTCAPLYDKALSWFTTAATNQNTETEYRAIIFADAASLFAVKKNYEKALEYIGPAIRIDQNRLYYRLQKTEYLIHLGRFDDAKSVIDRIDADKARYRLQLHSHQDMYSRLLKQLEMHMIRDQ
jgi:protein O-mannosyl-transferase